MSLSWTETLKKCERVCMCVRVCVCQGGLNDFHSTDCAQVTELRCTNDANSFTFMALLIGFYLVDVQA